MPPQRGLGMGDIEHGRRLDYICSRPRLGQRCTINHQQSNRRILRGLRVVPSNVSLSTAWSWAQACALQCSSVHPDGTLTLQPILILNGNGLQFGMYTFKEFSYWSMSNILSLSLCVVQFSMSMEVSQRLTNSISPTLRIMSLSPLALDVDITM